MRIDLEELAVRLAEERASVELDRVYCGCGCGIWWPREETDGRGRKREYVDRYHQVFARNLRRRLGIPSGSQNLDDIRNSPPRDRPPKRPCLAGDCDRPVRSNGYCGKHRAQVYGTNSAGSVDIIRISIADLSAMRRALRRMERGHRVAQRGSGWRNGPSPEVHR